MGRTHQYTVNLLWTGNRGSGTAGYAVYERSYTQHAAGKPDLQGSSDPAFRGDPTRYNPEELFVSTLSSCHMLWYLHLCAVNGIVVTDYRDEAKGIMTETADGGGRFTEVVLYPVVTVGSAGWIGRAMELHQEAGEKCFIANSVNFPVRCVPKCAVA